VVKPDRTVEGRRVLTSRSIGGSAVIDKGLQAGETVVIDGQLRLVPGAKVDIKNSLSEIAGEPGSKAPDRKDALQETQR